MYKSHHSPSTYAKLGKEKILLVVRPARFSRAFRQLYTHNHFFINYLFSSTSVSLDAVNSRKNDRCRYFTYFYRHQAPE